MLRRLVVTSLVGLFLLPAFSVSQTATDVAATQTAQRDTTAVGFVQASLAAMGGEKNIAQLQSGVFSVTVTPQRKGWPGGTEKLEFSGQQFRDEFTTDTNTTVSVTNSAGGTKLQGGKTVAIRAHVADARFIPELAALELYRRYQDSNYSVTLGTDSISGRSAVKVQVRLERDELSQLGTVQTWFFDAVTALPLRVEYRFPQDKNGNLASETAVEFGDWRSVSGVVVPFQLNTWLDGDPWNQVAVQSASFNVAVSPSEFTLAGGAQ